MTFQEFDLLTKVSLVVDVEMVDGSLLDIVTTLGLESRYEKWCPMVFISKTSVIKHSTCL